MVQCKVLTRTLSRLAAVKPVIGVATNMAASSGYWILSGCKTIYSTPSALLASIGIYILHMDYVKSMSSMYHTDFTLIKAGERKAEGMLNMTPELEAVLTALVVSQHARFQAGVNEGRGREIDPSFMQGQCLSGSECLAAGLVDWIGDDPYAQAIKDLLSL